MHEQIITLETAELAKKLGWSGDKCGCHKDNCIFDTIKTTQSLLQKWLREEKCVDIFIVPSIKEGAYDWLIVLEEDIKRIECEEYYHKYEDALEAGLQKGLELLNDEAEF